MSTASKNFKDNMKLDRADSQALKEGASTCWK